MGTDGHQGRWALSAPATPAWRRERPAIQSLRPVWRQPCSGTPEGQPGRWRSAEALPPAPLLRRAPDAPAARYGNKRATDWTGDTVPVTATGDEETPHLSPAVTTPPATPSDFVVLPPMQAPLATRQLPPGAPWVDAGSVPSAHLLTRRTEHSLDRLGPVRADQRGHEPAGTGVAAARCVIAGDATDALGPPGPRSVVWLERPDRQGQATVRLACRKPVWAAGARRADGTRAATAPRA
jgi:transposase